MVGRYGFISSDLSRANLALLITLVLYFGWMDFVLYNRVQSLQPLRLVTVTVQNGSGIASVPNFIPDSYSESVGGSVTGTISQTTGVLKKVVPQQEESASIFSPFTGLSMKLLMTDHVNHYLENPVALAISKVFHLDTKFLWITPNMLSFIGLVLAIIAGRCISWDGRCWQLTALALMLGRGLMDSLDGIVARDRRGITQHLSLYNTTGFYVDGIADSLGYTVFLFGCFFNLRRNVPKQYQPLPVVYQGEEKSKRKSDSGIISCNGSHWTSQRIFLVIFCLGLQLAASSGLWNYYSDAYHNLLETPRASESQAIVQNEVLKSTLMWLVIWLWRISNAHALVNWLFVAIVINKMWEFFVFMQFIGFAEIITLFLFTEIHYRDVTAYVNMVP